jgi:hypothetical protein
VAKNKSTNVATVTPFLNQLVSISDPSAAKAHWQAYVDQLDEAETVFSDVCCVMSQGSELDVLLGDNATAASRMAAVVADSRFGSIEITFRAFYRAQYGFTLLRSGRPDLGTATLREALSDSDGGSRLQSKAARVIVNDFILRHLSEISDKDEIPSELVRLLADIRRSLKRRIKDVTPDPGNITKRAVLELMCVQTDCEL